MRFGVLALASLVAVDPFGWDRFGPLRWWLVSTIGFAIVASAMLGQSRRLRWWPRWAQAGWALTLGGLTLSAALSDDRWHALVGTPDRHLGLITWLLGAGLFWAAGLWARSVMEPLSIAAAIGTAVGGIYALGELAGIDALDIGFAGDRVGGTFGQPAYLGAAMALCLPIVVGALDLRSENRWVERGWLSTAMVAALALGLLAFGASQARASWVGLAVAAAVLGVVRRRDLNSGRNLAFGLGATAAVAAILLVTPLGGRLWALTDIDGGVVAGRVDEWQVGADALVGADAGGLIGYGPEGYRTIFGRFVDEQYVIDHGRDAITDRAHNGVLDTALAGGLLAGVGIVVLYLGVTRAAVIAIDTGSRLEIGWGVAVIAYVVQQLFLFPLAELDPLFWAIAGVVTARASGGGSAGELARPVALVFGGIVAVIAVAASVAGVLDIAADHRVDTATKRTDPALAESATDLRPDSIRYAFIASRLAPTPEQALDHLAAGLDVSPDDPALLTEHASVLLDRARLTDRADHLTDALQALEALGVDDPHHPESQLRLGVARALAGDVDGAVTALTHAAELAPTSSEPLLNLALVLIDNGRLDEARTTLETATDRDPSDPRIQPLLDEISAIERA